ncbi:hypothetical protein G5C60_47670 [Streptomyces sp. HC44]|uniref:Uncharacterized protein n=1 Tax=Streptomyces scabichelini TaxID=2711217 RepID=A0A6G4VLL1_9ACTN|nr:hypothetical protein [Streptomyces scabichelini]NGO15068.1 hypothetical protein [Streptomyces scabichelini]
MAVIPASVEQVDPRRIIQKRPAWTQRAVRTGHIQSTLRAVQNPHRGESELDAHPTQRLGHALGLMGRAMNAGSSNAGQNLRDLMTW